MVLTEIIIACLLALVILTGLPIGVWHLIHVLKRKHRLEKEEDERRNKKQLAEDFAVLIKELGEGSLPISFQDYVSPMSAKKLPPGVVTKRSEPE
jgi:hypothetical protein